MDELNKKEAILPADVETDLDANDENKQNEQEIKQNKKKSNFKISLFLKRNGFYLGLGVLIIILAVVLVFDGNRIYHMMTPFISLVTIPFHW